MKRVARMARLVRIRRAHVEKARHDLAVAVADEQARAGAHTRAREGLDRAGRSEGAWPVPVWTAREAALARAAAHLESTRHDHVEAVALTRQRRADLVNMMRRRDAFERLHDRLSRAARMALQVQQQKTDDELHRLSSPRLWQRVEDGEAL
ncbi:MAG: hypothetical protein ACE5IK_05740 [Acidobacteriota bacterium]